MPKIFISIIIIITGNWARSEKTRSGIFLTLGGNDLVLQPKKSLVLQAKQSEFYTHIITRVFFVLNWIKSGDRCSLISLN